MKQTISDFMREILEVYERDYNQSIIATAFINDIKNIYKRLKEKNDNNTYKTG